MMSSGCVCWSKLRYVLNNCTMYFAYIFVYLYFIYKCDNSFLVYVCVWIDYYFVLDEPIYDEFHVRDGEAQHVPGKCSDRGIGFYFICYNFKNNIVVLCFLLQCDFFSFRMSDLIFTFWMASLSHFFYLFNVFLE